MPRHRLQDLDLALGDGRIGGVNKARVHFAPADIIQDLAHRLRQDELGR